MPATDAVQMIEPRPQDEEPGDLAVQLDDLRLIRRERVQETTSGPLRVETTHRFQTRPHRLDPNIGQSFRVVF